MKVNVADIVKWDSLRNGHRSLGIVVAKHPDSYFVVRLHPLTHNATITYGMAEAIQFSYETNEPFSKKGAANG